MITKKRYCMPLCITMMVLLPVCGMAANMCIANDTAMVVLDPIIGGSSTDSNATAKTWSVTFSYGTISGIGSCVDADCTTQGCISTNQTNKSTLTTGNYCYCKMLRPVQSRWVYSVLLNYCASHCASFCASSVSSAVAVRRGLFSTAGI